MEKLNRDKVIYLCVFIGSVIFGVLGIIGSVFFALKIIYAPMVISLALALYGIYASPFWFIAYSNRVWAERILSCETSDIDTVSKKLKIKPTFVKKCLDLAKRKEYILNK